MENKDIEALLPFYINGTLGEIESAQVQKAVAQSAALRSEVEALRLIKTNMQANAPKNAAAELGLARLMRDIEADALPTPANDTARAPFRISPLFGGAMAAMVALAFYAGTAISPDKLEYIQASGEDYTAVLTVRFQPEVTQQAAAATLLEHGLEVVGGPSARGFYRLLPLEDCDMDSLAEILRAESLVFEFVETPQ